MSGKAHIASRPSSLDRFVDPPVSTDSVGLRFRVGASKKHMEISKNIGQAIRKIGDGRPASFYRKAGGHKAGGCWSELCPPAPPTGLDPVSPSLPLPRCPAAEISQVKVPELNSGEWVGRIRERLSPVYRPNEPGSHRTARRHFQCVLPFVLNILGRRSR
jgi:hypothetical protein